MMMQHRNHVLDTVTLLINSCPPASSTEELGNLDVVREFITARTITEVADLTPDDVEHLHLVRSQFRSIFTAPDENAKTVLVNELLASAKITPRLVEHDHLGIHFHYFPPLVSLAEHLFADGTMAIAFLINSGEVSRLRVCTGQDCARVFVDSSKNRSRTYCDSKTCGARLHAAAYRQRQRQKNKTR
jgi:hypothetical protein